MTIANNPTQSIPQSPPINTRLASVALAALLTLGTLAGVNTLAMLDTAAPQLAQGSSTNA